MYRPRLARRRLSLVSNPGWQVDLQVHSLDNGKPVRETQVANLVDTDVSNVNIQRSLSAWLSTYLGHGRPRVGRVVATKHRYGASVPVSELRQDLEGGKPKEMAGGTHCSPHQDRNAPVPGHGTMEAQRDGCSYGAPVPRTQARRRSSDRPSTTLRGKYARPTQPLYTSSKTQQQHMSASRLTRPLAQTE